MKRVLISLCFPLFISIDSDAQWSQVSSAPTDFLFNILIVDDTIYISHPFNGIYKSTDGMLSWHLVNNGLSNNFSKAVYEITYSNGDLYAATADGIYKSTNEGSEWLKKSNGIIIDPGSGREYTQSIFELNGILLAGSINGIYYSTDEAENWILTNVSGQHISAKNFTEHNGILFAARESGNQPNGYKSFDNGITWENLTGLSVPAISFFSEPGNLWAGTVHAVWRSEDNGISWDVFENGLPPDPYNTWIIRVNNLLVTSLGTSGIFISKNEGVLWEDFSEGLPVINTILKLVIYNDKILALSNQGLWQRDTASVVTQLDINENAVPEFVLYQNYPNPFNPKTNIEFRIADLEFVSLKVYDVLGREVATLVNEVKQQGVYTVNFDGSNLSGGVYSYRLLAGSFSETKKMIFLK